jgi:hypothetical protein
MSKNENFRDMGNNFLFIEEGKVTHSLCKRVSGTEKKIRKMSLNEKGISRERNIFCPFHILRESVFVQQSFNNVFCDCWKLLKPNK